MKVLVAIVTFIFLFTYGSVWYIVLLDDTNYWFGTFAGNAQILLQMFIFTMALYSYYVALTTPPGRIPPNWVPDGYTQEELEEAKQAAFSKENNRKRNIELSAARYCDRCQNFKPPRAHHCQECKICIPRMDHHCPWVNNCVGNGNHKLFIVFLFWGVLGIFYALGVLVTKTALTIYAAAHEEEVHFSILKGIILVANFAILFPIVCGMFSLFCFQTQLAFLNKTTIESHVSYYAKRDAKKKGEKYVWPYNFGAKQNFLMFFDRSVLRWFLPVVPRNLGNGLSYPAAYSLDSQFRKKEDDIIDV